MHDSSTHHHFVLVVGGIANFKGITGKKKRAKIKKLVQYGFEPVFLPINWFKRCESSYDKLQNVLDVIDSYSKLGSISLVGISAGATLALTAFCERKDLILSVVAISGRVRSEKWKHLFLSLPAIGIVIPSYPELIRTFEELYEPQLTFGDKKKISTVRGMFDELIPLSFSPIAGARVNLQLPTRGHSWNILAALDILPLLLTNGTAMHV